MLPVTKPFLGAKAHNKRWLSRSPWRHPLRSFLLRRESPCPTHTKSLLLQTKLGRLTLPKGQCLECSGSSRYKITTAQSLKTLKLNHQNYTKSCTCLTIYLLMLVFFFILAQNCNCELLSLFIVHCIISSFSTLACHINTSMIQLTPVHSILMLFLSILKTINSCICFIYDNGSKLFHGFLTFDIAPVSLGWYCFISLFISLMPHQWKVLHGI